MRQRIDKTSPDERLDALLAAGLPGLPADPAAVGRTLDAIAAERALTDHDSEQVPESDSGLERRDSELDQLLALLDRETGPRSTEAARGRIFEAIRGEEDEGLLRPFEDADPLWDVLGAGLPARASTAAAREAVLAGLRSADEAPRQSRSRTPTGGTPTGGTMPVEPMRIGPRPSSTSAFGLILKIAAALLVMATVAVLLNRTPDDSRVAIEREPGAAVDEPETPAPRTMRIPDDPSAPSTEPVPDPDQKDHDPLEWILANPIPKKATDPRATDPKATDPNATDPNGGGARPDTKPVRPNDPAVARKPADSGEAGGSSSMPPVDEEMQLAQRYDLTPSELEVVKNLELLKRLEEAEVYAVVMDLDLLGAVESEDFE